MEYKVLLESILENLDEGVFVVDTSAKVTFFNEPASNVAGVNPSEVIGKNILEIFPGLTEDSSTFYKVLNSQKPMIDYVQTYHNNRGEIVKTVTSTIPLFRHGQIVGAMELYRSLDSYTELKDQIANLQLKGSQNRPGPKENKGSHKGNGTRYVLEDIVGLNPAIEELKASARQVADSRSPILVYGETGTGKELLVQGIHNASKDRSNGPFIALNCAAIPASLLEGILFGTSAGSFTGAKDKAGLFELACGGSLFLDEINSMGMDLQAKLLRVLQEGVVRRVGDGKTILVDVRVMASSNEDPLQAVHQGNLRMDLYYRLNVIALTLPPLRQRKEDIPLLVTAFIHLCNDKLNKRVEGYDLELINFLMAYHWPGNVRELSCVIERMMNFARGKILTMADLPRDLVIRFQRAQESPYKAGGPHVHKPFLQPGGSEVNQLVKPHISAAQPATNGDLSTASLKDQMNTFEKSIVENALNRCDGNGAKAAKLLGIPRQTLHNKLKKYQLQALSKK